jgi:hypothetical protein
MMKGGSHRNREDVGRASSIAMESTVGSPSVAAKDHRWLLLSRRRQLPAHLLAVIAISHRADTAIDGRFDRENPEALEQMRQADRDAEGAAEVRS